MLINTRLIDHELAEPQWAQRMTDDDRRGLTPLLWSHVALYARWILKMDEWLDYTRGPQSDPDGAVTQPVTAAMA